MASWQVYTLLGIALAFVLGIPFMASRLRELELSRAGLGHLNEWTDHHMLEHVTRILSAMGYRVGRAGEAYPAFDLLLTDGLGQQRAVLVRHWRKVIDAAVVKDLANAAVALGRGAAMIVTIERYTPGARAVGRATETILWSLPDLARAIGQIQSGAVAFPDLPAQPRVINPPYTIEMLARAPATAEATPAPVPQSDGRVPMRSRRRSARMRKGEKWSGGDTPFCPRCGKKMAPRNTPDGREFWACVNYPRCLGSRPK